jgi:hypothetical protein
MSWTYTGDPTASDVAAVRFEIQDTNQTAPLLQDEEIEFAIMDETGTAAQTPQVITGGPLYSSAARCCEVLARNFSMQADRILGALTETYSKMAINYANQAKELRAKASGYGAPYVGGQSESEKEGFRQNQDLPRPKFRRSQFDNSYAGWADRDGGLPPMTD